MALACEAPPAGPAGLNVGGEDVRIRDAAAIVRSLLPDAELEVLPGVRDGSAGYEPEATKRAIGYEPAFPLREGLRRTIAALRAQAGLPPV